jgi:ribosomal protein S18 acetylase RimI-like enzyme
VERGHRVRRYTRAMVGPTSSAPARPRPSPAWTVRPARSGDAEAWHALQRTIYREGVAFVGDGAPSVGALTAKLRSRAPHDLQVAVAVAAGGAGDEIVGWLEVQRMAPRRLAHVAWLTLAVAPGWRRRGVGRALMAEARTWALAHGLRKLQLHVRAGNAAAIALYLRLGYEREGVLRDQVGIDAADGEGFEDEWIMSLRLTGPA